MGGGTDRQTQISKPNQELKQSQWKLIGRRGRVGWGCTDRVSKPAVGRSRGCPLAPGKIAVCS